MTVIQVKGLNLSIRQKTILQDIHFQVFEGDFIGLIGPNGSGKSSLLKSIASIQKSTNGTIDILGKEIKRYKQKQLARQLCYVPQDTKIDFDFKAKEIVLMGRHVHKTRFQADTHEDLLKVQTSMEQTNTWHLAGQSILSLSGGQRQLVLIAKALVQEAPILLLDEPISALDIYYQLHILSKLRQLSQEGKTVIVVLHDLNLASRFCNKLLLLEKGRIKTYGTASQVLTEENLRQTYNVKSVIRDDDVTSSLSVTALY